MIRKIKDVVKGQLMQGVTPKGLALSFAMATILGIFPVLGSTTLLCFLAGLALRLNQPLLQALNYLVYPLQLLLLPVFLKAGQVLFGAPPLVVDLQAMMAQFTADWKAFLIQYGWAGVHAIVVWSLIAPLLAAVIFFATRPVFEKIQLKVVKT